MIPTFTVDMASTLAPFGWAMVAFIGAGLAAIIAGATMPLRSEPDVPASEPCDEPSEEPSEEMDEFRPAA